MSYSASGSFRLKSGPSTRRSLVSRPEQKKYYKTRGGFAIQVGLCKKSVVSKSKPRILASINWNQI